MTTSFARYDSRGYRTLGVAAGYAAWAPFYDATMDDRLDIPLLGSLVSVDWSNVAAAVDLGCGYLDGRETAREQSPCKIAFRAVLPDYRSQPCSFPTFYGPKAITL
jgi:hypothetical protein